jgi:hypothetical protein
MSERFLKAKHAQRRKARHARSWSEHEELIVPREDHEWVQREMKKFDALPKEVRQDLRNGND